MHARACTRRQEGPTFGNQFFLSLLSSDQQADASAPESSFCLFAFGFSPYRASLSSPDCPETHHIDQPGLQLRDPPACVLGLREGPLHPAPLSHLVLISVPTVSNGLSSPLGL